MTSERSLISVYGSYLSGEECCKQLKNLLDENRLNWPTIEKCENYDKLMNATIQMCVNSWSELSPKTYDDVRALFLMFIDGYVPGTPLYSLPGLTGDIEPKIAADLRAINFAGMITEDSQPGIIDEFEMQREYLNGFIPQVKMRQFARALKEQRNIQLGMISVRNKGAWLKIRTELEPAPKNTIPRIEGRELPLTLEISDNKFHTYSSLALTVHDGDNSYRYDFNFENELHLLLHYTTDDNLKQWCSENLCYVFVYARHWGTNGKLIEEIRRAIESVE